MPNFDGNGPLKRGRVIGRGLGPCRRSDDGCDCCTEPQTIVKSKEKQAE